VPSALKRAAAAASVDASNTDSIGSVSEDKPASVSSGSSETGTSADSNGRQSKGAGDNKSYNKATIDGDSNSGADSGDNGKGNSRRMKETDAAYSYSLRYR
jgi:hypothetical protein